MAKYTIRHTCGHEREVQLFGPMTGRASRRAYLATLPCPACLRERETVRALASAEAHDLPVLAGSDKQCDWAERIRHATLALIPRVLAERTAGTDIDWRTLPVTPNAADRIGADDTGMTAGEAFDQLRSIVDSHWWIDHARDVDWIERDNNPLLDEPQPTPFAWAVALIRDAAGVQARPKVRQPW